MLHDILFTVLLNSMHHLLTHILILITHLGKEEIGSGDIQMFFSGPLPHSKGLALPLHPQLHPAAFNLLRSVFSPTEPKG